ncbi:MAG: anaerobic ribonucleoside-triphosphate reductase activating protein [Patescibacteria group bacterium]|nr:anaerobic ribonucleoside-triphosphate reductase activating protein [Patescibacteria group bacterium]MCL5095746.1 anaerobic ribonucleoside-triphosphate reductase activating protein [Patescibacteria group bacterium]
MIKIKGLQKTTLLDYPGKVAAIIFVAGCNFRCPFCHNSDLVLRPETLPEIKEEDFFIFLKNKRQLLDGIVVTGGEPTLYEDLPAFIKKIKKLGFLIKLDTNGTNPGMVKDLLAQKLLDYVAIDYKGPLIKYYKYTNTTNKQINKQISECINILIKSGLDFELRTTVVPTLHNREDLIEMAKDLSSIIHNPSSIKWFLQQFNPGQCLDKSFEKLKPYPKEFFDKVLPKLRKLIPKTELRGI